MGLTHYSKPDQILIDHQANGHKFEVKSGGGRYYLYVDEIECDFGDFGETLYWENDVTHAKVTFESDSIFTSVAILSINDTRVAFKKC